MRVSLISLLAAATAFQVSAASPSLPADALPVPIVSQATSYSCGAAAALSLLYYWRIYDGTESELYAELETTPEQGTHPDKIAQGLRARGLKAEVRKQMTIDQLRASLARGAAVILDIQAWPENAHQPIAWEKLWDDGHYVVLVGIDRDYVYVMDPSTRASYGYIPIRELLKRWHDWEDRYGYVQVHRRLGIVVEGVSPLPRFPGPLLRVE